MKEAIRSIYNSASPYKKGNAMAGAPAGYYTCDEFRRLANEDLKEICKKYGVL